MAVPCASVHADPLPRALPSDLLMGVQSGPLNEIYVPEALSTQTPWATGYTLNGSLPLSPWDRLWLRVSFMGYDLDDPDFPGTRHHRTETRVTAGELWLARAFGGEWGVGLGYSFQSIRVGSTANAPYSDPSFLFTAWQQYHGPALITRYRRPMGAYWLSLDADAVAYPFVQTADPRLALSQLASIRVCPGLTFFDQRLGLYYTYERLIGAEYYRDSSGVMATLALGGF